MNLEIRKLNFIQDFLRINNEKIVLLLEKILTEEKRKLYDKNLSPYTIEEFDKLIDKSEDDLKLKKFKSSKLLKSEAKAWI